MTLQEINKRVDKKFDKKFIIPKVYIDNDIEVTSADNIKQFIYAQIKQAVLDVLKSKKKLDHFCKCENKNFISWEADEYYDMINELEELIYEKRIYITSNY